MNKPLTTVSTTTLLRLCWIETLLTTSYDTKHPKGRSAGESNKSLLHFRKKKIEIKNKRVQPELQHVPNFPIRYLVLSPAHWTREGILNISDTAVASTAKSLNFASYLVDLSKYLEL